MENSLISVIIPFYNEELYLERAANSVLNQTYKNIEIILINDGSTDNSKNIATEICKKNTQCKLITISNNGPGNARNIGLKQSNSTYVCFLDADDELHHEALMWLTKSIEKHHSDLVMGMYTMLDNNQSVLKKSSWNELLYLDANKAISLLINEKLIPTVWGKLFKTSIAQKCKFPIKSWKEDDVFMLHYLKQSTYISIINKSLITLHCRNNSLTRQVISKEMILDIAYSFNQQQAIIKGDKHLENALIKNEINTFLNLFLILKIDWKKINNKKELFSLYKKEINLLSKKSKKYSLGIKKRMLIYFLQSVNYLGKSPLFFIIGLLKKNKLIELKKIKS